MFKLYQDKLQTKKIRTERMQRQEGKTEYRVNQMSDSECPVKRNHQIETLAPTTASDLRVKYCAKLIKIEGRGDDLEDGETASVKL